MILDGLKSLFVPSEDIIQSCIDSIKDKFCITFGVGGFDIKNLSGASIAVTDSDYSGDYTVGGQSYHFTFIKTEFLVNALTTFRPYIRGLFMFFLWLYCLNQVMSLINKGPISLGGHVDTNLPPSVGYGSPQLGSGQNLLGRGRK